MTGLTLPEKTLLLNHETIIKDNLNSFIKVCKSLIVIRDGKLYKDYVDINTFEEYCAIKWGISLSTGNHLLRSGEVINNLESNGITELPKNKSQCFELGILDDRDQVVVWNNILSEANEPTTSVVRDKAREHIILNNSPDWIRYAYKEDLLTITKAYKLIKIYNILSDNLKHLCDLYAYTPDGIIDTKTLTTLITLEIEYPDILDECLYTGGYISLSNGEQVFFNELQASQIESLISKKKFFETLDSQTNIMVGETNSIIVNGEVELNNILHNDDVVTNQVMCIFPDSENTISLLQDKGYNIAFLVVTKNQPSINLDGQKGNIQTLIANIKKPKWITNMLKDMLWSN